MRHSRWEISLDKNDFRDFYLDTDLTTLALLDGQVELKLIKCAITANNVTYALLGNIFGPWQRDAGYWDFFSRHQTRGVLPVWGLAEVVESRNELVNIGKKVYGFFPLASHCRLLPEKIKASGFIDSSKHRADLPAVYNHYVYTDQIPTYSLQDEDYWPVFRPLLITAFMINDQLAEQDFYGAESIIMASASSKTASATAACIAGESSRPRLIGLTSEKNKAFVSRSGFYDDVFAYDQIESIASDKPAVFVDMAGNRDITSRIHQHFNEQLKYSLIVGKSHWGSQLPDRDMPGPQLEAFFAPARIGRRLKEWGPAEYGKRLEDAWRNVLSKVKGSFLIEHSQDIEASLQAAIEGQLDPKTGLMLTF